MAECVVSALRSSLWDLTPADAIGAFQIGFPAVEAAGDFPNGLRCDRQILCIKACHSEPHQISLFCSTLKNEGDYVIIPENPCTTYKQVCVHTGEGNHPRTLPADGLASNWLRSQLVSTLFSQCQSPINYEFAVGLLWCVTPLTDANVFQWCCQGYCVTGADKGNAFTVEPLCWLNDQKTEVKKGVNLQMCIVQGAFGDCHAASEMINHHDVYWSMWAVKIILHCHYII